MIDPLLYFPIGMFINYQCMSYIFPLYSFFTALEERKKTEFISRINSTLFQLFMCGSYFYIKTDEDIITLYRIGTGYLIFDLVFVQTITMHIHHIVCILIYIFGLPASTATDRLFMYRTIVTLEASPIVITLCWMLETFQYPKNALHKAVQIFSFLYWSSLRMIAFPYLFFTEGSTTMQLFVSPLLVLNTYWFYLLVKKIK